MIIIIMFSKTLYMEHSYTVNTATGSNSGLSVLLKDTSTGAGIDPATP